MTGALDSTRWVHRVGRLSVQGDLEHRIECRQGSFGPNERVPRSLSLVLAVRTEETLHPWDYCHVARTRPPVTMRPCPWL